MGLIIASRKLIDVVLQNIDIIYLQAKCYQINIPYSSSLNYTHTSAEVESLELYRMLRMRSWRIN